MSKKSLFFGSAVLLIAMLFTLAGCDNPTGPEGPKGDTGIQGSQGQEVTGDQGPEGEFGGYRLSGVVKPVDLEIAFEKDDVAVLLTNVTSVYGIVPPGKTLYVQGRAAYVAAGQKLELKDGAVLNIHDSATLWATGISNIISGVSTETGLLVASNGAAPRVEGDGTIFLPGVLDKEAYTRSLHWESDEVTVSRKYPGSFYDGSDIIGFDSAGIRALFARHSTISIPDVPALTASAIPSGKTLTLLGTGNSLAGPFDLVSNATLIVDAKARLVIPGPFTGKSGSAFINYGKGKDDTGIINLGVDLGNTGSILPGGTALAPNLSITNDGTIFTSSTVLGTISPLLAFGGTGAIAVSGVVDYSGEATGILLKQNLELNLLASAGPVVNFSLPGIADPFDDESDSGKTITIGEFSNLVLDNDSTLIGYLDGTPTPAPVRFKVVNNGTITTSTVVSSTLASIFSSLQLNAGGEKGTVIADGEVKLDGPFEIPEKTVLSLTNGSVDFAAVGPGATARDLIINGALNIATSIDLEPPENVTVSATGTIAIAGGSTFTVALAKTFDISSTAVFEGAGSLFTGNTTLIKIAGTEGYSFDVAGVIAEEYADALTNIETVKGKLTDTVDLTNSLFAGFSERAIGTVNLSLSAANIAVPVVSSATAAGNVIGLPNDPGSTTITVSSGGVGVMAGTSVFNSPSSFTLAVTTDNLTLADADITGSIDKFGVLEYTKYKIANSGITTPELTDVFHIGVKSKRP